MEKPSSGERADGLEIASIGALYRDPWDKKYWSSSRGKDRYPFPVGYHAVRSHAGSTYQLEVREGSKGPIFVVTSTDGDSCSGQTPDIAWENFQKKSGPRMKNWHGKKSSSKIDGIELFGFRNPFVQRLLRELVANVGGLAELNTLSSNFQNGAIQLDHELNVQASQSYPDLLPYLGKKQITGKRSMKTKASIRSFNREGRTKRICSLDHPCLEGGTSGPPLSGGWLPGPPLSGKIGKFCDYDKISSGMQLQEKSIPKGESHDELARLMNIAGDSVNEEIMDSISSALRNDGKNSIVDPSPKNHDGMKDPQMPSSMVINVSINAERHGNSGAKCDPLMELNDKDHSVDKHVILSGRNKLADHEASKHPCMEHMLHSADKHDESSDAEVAQGSGLADPKGSDVDVRALSRDLELCAPDTLDPLKGEEESVNKNQQSCALPDQICHPVTSSPEDDAFTKGLVKDSVPEVSSDSGSSNSNMEKVDLDSAGQELAKSMMTFLLPRAVPLLKRTYERRRSRFQSQKPNISSCISSPLLTSSGENVDIGFSTVIDFKDKLSSDMPVKSLHSSVQEKLTAPQVDPGSPCLVKVESPATSCRDKDTFREIVGSKDVQSLVPDSFDDENLAHDAALQKPFPSGSVGNDNLTSSESKNTLAYEEMHVDNKEEGMVSKLESGDSFFTGSLPRIYPDAGVHLEENVNHEPIPRDENAASCLKLSPPTTDHANENSGHGNIAKASVVPTQNISGFPENIFRVSTSHAQVENDKPITMDSIGAGFKSQVGGTENPLAEIGWQELISRKVDPSEGYMPKAAHSIVGLVSHSDKEGKLPHSLQTSTASSVPLSESIICRYSPKAYSNSMTHRAENSHCGTTSNDLNRLSGLKEAASDGYPNLMIVDDITVSEGSMTIATQNQGGKKIHGADGKFSKFIDPILGDGDDKLDDAHAGCQFYVPKFQNLQNYSCNRNRNVVHEISAGLANKLPEKSTSSGNYMSFPHRLLDQRNHLNGPSSEMAKSNKELQAFMELAGCYLHPAPVLSVFLSSKEHDLRIGVLCGLPEACEKNLFVYMVPIRRAPPTFLGYTFLVFPLLEGPLHGQLPLERSVIQFSPDGQFLVFVNSIKAPHCSEQDANCSCLNCKSNYSDGSMIEVAHLEYGFVSSVAKLETMEKMPFILVCEPNYLVAVKESGGLHVWIMNLTWSSNLDEFDLPSFDYLPAKISELKTIPNCPSLVIGHNGIGDFGLWDISRRVLLTRFSSTGYKTFQMLPVCILNWRKACDMVRSLEIEKHIKEALTENVLFPKAGEGINILLEGDDAAVCVLVSAASDLEAPDDDKTRGERGLTGWWRLAFLAKNMVFMGNVFDSRACAVDASGDYGITGTCDGLVYLWELSSGKKLTDLHSFKCGAVSCVKADAKSGTLAVASNEGQLLVYVQSRAGNVNSVG